MNFDKEIGENKVVRISVDYQRGDYRGRRGIFVRFDNITLIRRDDYTMEQWSPCDGFSVFCEAMKRANAKTLKKWEDGVEAIKNKLLDHWRLDQRDAICTTLSNI